MNFRHWMLLSLLPLITLSACKSNTDTTAPPPSDSSQGPRYKLSTGPNSTAWHPLQSGDTVETVLAQNPLPSPHGPMTVVLIHRGPEGRSRELIQLDSQGNLMDPKQNYVLRDGDELIYPGSTPPGQGNPSPGH